MLRRLALCVAMGLLCSGSLFAQTFNPGPWSEPGRNLSWQYLGYTPLANAQRSCQLRGGILPDFQSALKAVSSGIASQDRNSEWQYGGQNILTSGSRKIWTSTLGEWVDEQTVIGTDGRDYVEFKVRNAHAICAFLPDQPPTDPQPQLTTCGSCEYTATSGAYAKGCYQIYQGSSVVGSDCGADAKGSFWLDLCEEKRQSDPRCSNFK